jgi:N-methylhydantoinase A
MSPADQPNTIRIGVDIGGTFTDFVVYHPRTGRLESFKVLSTPDNPARAVLDGLKKILNSLDDDHLPTGFDMIHGSTVATNALLERKGARTALITTEGFRDVLQIGRQNRRSLYDLFDTPPPPLVPAELRFEVRERVDQSGNVLEEINPVEVERLVGISKACLSRRLRSASSSLSCTLNTKRESQKALKAAVSLYAFPARFCRNIANTSAPAQRSSMHM